MANVKQDLLNKLGTDKYYAELELGRLAADPNMIYLQKIELMAYQLQLIAILNGQIALAGQYFPDQVVAPAPVATEGAAAQPVQQAGAQPHPGQTFAE